MQLISPLQLSLSAAGAAAPERIVCSGHAGGGAWAQICGVWAQVMYPSANIRVVSFGAPL